jgi:FlaG/FlaF family flagellin (archaellin)
MTNKRGLSDVVTTVLIVLLTIVAIAILWSFLQPMFTKSGAKIQQAEACLSVNLEVTRCTAADAGVIVKRNPGVADLKSIKLIFDKGDGTTSVQNCTASVPQELGSAVCPGSLTAIGFAPTKVSIAAGIADAQGVVTYCNPTQPSACI